VFLPVQDREPWSLNNLNAYNTTAQLDRLKFKLSARPAAIAQRALMYDINGENGDEMHASGHQRTLEWLDGYVACSLKVSHRHLPHDRGVSSIPMQVKINCRLWPEMVEGRLNAKVPSDRFGLGDGARFFTSGAGMLRPHPLNAVAFPQRAKNAILTVCAAVCHFILSFSLSFWPWNESGKSR
jgi:hypothetical protein